MTLDRMHGIPKGSSYHDGKRAMPVAKYGFGAFLDTLAGQNFKELINKVDDRSPLQSINQSLDCLLQV